MLFLSEVLLASKSLQTAIESFDILHLVVYSLDWQRCALDLLVALVLIPRVGVLIFNSCQEPPRKIQLRWYKQDLSLSRILRHKTTR